MDKIEIDHIRDFESEKSMEIAPPVVAEKYKGRDDFEEEAYEVVGGYIHDKFGDGTYLIPFSWTPDRSY